MHNAAIDDANKLPTLSTQDVSDLISSLLENKQYLLPQRI